MVYFLENIIDDILKVSNRCSERSLRTYWDGGCWTRTTVMQEHAELTVNTDKPEIGHNNIFEILKNN